MFLVRIHQYDGIGPGKFVTKATSRNLIATAVPGGNPARFRFDRGARRCHLLELIKVLLKGGVDLSKVARKKRKSRAKLNVHERQEQRARAVS